MKLFTVEILKVLGGSRLEIGGRNCCDAIVVGDELRVETRPSVRVKVTEIEVYHRVVNELHHGYVGTLRVDIFDGDGPRLDENLVVL